MATFEGRHGSARRARVSKQKIAVRRDSECAHPGRAMPGNSASVSDDMFMDGFE
jgi:hypothetical protein